MTLKRLYDLIMIIETAEDINDVYASAKELGYSGTIDEFNAELDEIKNSKILKQELSDEELAAASGGGNTHCNMTWCHNTYEKGENCWIDDDCNIFINGYTGL